MTLPPAAPPEHRPDPAPGPARRLRPRAPLLLVVPAVLGAAFLVLPLVALVVRAPWPQLGTRLADPATLDALRLSLVSATAATVLALLLGVPLAWLLARTRWPGVRLLRVLVTVPLVLPPVVGGVALLLLLGRRGLAGRWLDLWFGIQVPFTTVAVVLAEAFVAMPFLVVAVEGALRGADRRYEEAAATLGAGPLLVARRVTLPMIGHGIAAGTALAFARSLGEFGATITFAGSLPGTTRTMPLAIYLAMSSDPASGIALSLVLLAASAVVLLALRDRWLPGVRP